jgi:hypothetical protein
MSLRKCAQRQAKNEAKPKLHELVFGQQDVLVIRRVAIIEKFFTLSNRSGGRVAASVRSSSVIVSMPGSYLNDNTGVAKSDCILAGSRLFFASTLSKIAFF